MARLPLVILGAGSIGQRHMVVAAADPDIDLVAVVEPHQPQRAQLAKAGWPMVADLANAPHAEAAIIATPTAEHAQAASSCLDAQMAVLVEKPIAHTLADAQAMVDKAQAQGLPLFVGHHRRCHPFAIKARAALDQLGEIVGVQGLWSLRKHDSYFDAPWRTRPGAGPLMTNLSHEVDLLHFLLGEITKVTALIAKKARRLQVEDSAALSFSFANGALGSFFMSDAGLSPWAFEAASGENPAVARSDEDYLRFTGTRGAMAFPSGTRWQVTSGPQDWTNALTRKVAEPDVSLDPLAEQLKRFARIAKGGEDDILCRGAQGTQALKVTLATAYAAAKGHAVTPDDVPLDYNGT